MSQAPNKNQKYARLLNDVIEFADSYGASKKITGVNAASVKWLYSALVNYCNYLRWRMPFSISDRRLAQLTGMDIKTITKARDVLIQRKKILVATDGIDTFYLFDNKFELPGNMYFLPRTSATEIGTSATEIGTSATEIGTSTTEIGRTRKNPTLTPPLENTTNQQSDNNEKNFQDPSLATAVSVAVSAPVAGLTDSEQNFKTEKITPTAENFSTKTTTTGETYNKTVIEEENSEKQNSEVESIDESTFQLENERKNLGGDGQVAQQNFSEKFRELVKEYGQDTVNQALYQVRQHQERTGKKYLTTDYKYMRTTCQRILGMQPSSDFSTKHKHEPQSKESKVLGGFIPDPPSMQTYDKVIALLEESERGNQLITKRYHIFDDEYKKAYQDDLNEYDMLGIMIDILEDYESRGLTDKEYKERKKARGGQW